MKKKNIINLIKYHSEKNDIQFKNEAAEIARYFDSVGDHELAEYVMSLISEAGIFVPQNLEVKSVYLSPLENKIESLPLPFSIMEDVKGIINSISYNIGMNKFLFYGAPGTGKTETAKQISRLLERKLLLVETSRLVDSKLGETSKNIVNLFNEINNLNYPEEYVILFDELDSIALDRVNTNDLREMGRATSTLLKELENVNDNIVIIATTNLFNNFDKAMIRRFDATVDFNRYTREELIEISGIILDSYLLKLKSLKKDSRLFKKIINLYQDIPYPGDLKNIIKTSLGFSNPNYEYDYLIRLFNNVSGNISNYSLNDLYDKGFTLREIEVLTGISKSQVFRDLKEDN